MWGSSGAAAVARAGGGGATAMRRWSTSLPPEATAPQLKPKRTIGVLSRRTQSSAPRPHTPPPGVAL